MDYFSPHCDGPEYEPSLVGPDGRLTRLSKGGRNRANALAQQANQTATQTMNANAAAAKQANQIAMNAATAARKSASADAKRLTAALSAAQSSNSSATAPTQFIDDPEAISKSRRGAGAMGGFGMSSSKALSKFGLGGGSSYLG